MSMQELMFPISDVTDQKLKCAEIELEDEMNTALRQKEVSSNLVLMQFVNICWHGRFAPCRRKIKLKQEEQLYDEP